MLKKRYINDLQTFFDELRNKKEVKFEDLYGTSFIKWYGRNDFKLHFKVGNNHANELLDFETLLFHADKMKSFNNVFYVEEESLITFEDLKQAKHIKIYHSEKHKPHEYMKVSERWPAEKEMIFKYALENEYFIEIVE